VSIMPKSSDYCLLAYSYIFSGTYSNELPMLPVPTYITHADPTIQVPETPRRYSMVGVHSSGGHYASDYFKRRYNLAEKLIVKEKAYVCHCDEAKTKLQRGSENK